MRYMFITSMYVKLNLRKSANVGSEKIRRSFPGQICFVFLFSLHDCSHPSSHKIPSAHLRSCSECAMHSYTMQCDAMQSAHRKDAMQSYTIQCNAVQRNTIECNPMKSAISGLQ